MSMYDDPMAFARRVRQFVDSEVSRLGYHMDPCEPGHGHCDSQKKVIRAPEADRSVRLLEMLHELGHANTIPQLAKDADFITSPAAGRKVLLEFSAWKWALQKWANLGGDVPLRPTLAENVSHAILTHVYMASENADFTKYWLPHLAEMLLWAQPFIDLEPLLMVLERRIKTNPDTRYYFHATNLERAHEIAASGKLVTHKPWEYTDQSTWPDGSTEKRSYFASEPASVMQFAPEGEPIVLAVPTDAADFKVERGTGDRYVTKPISAKHLYFFDNADGRLFNLAEFEVGMKEEREHDDVTGGDLNKVARIVKAHLGEDAQYYTKLKKAGLNPTKKIRLYRASNNEILPPDCAFFARSLDVAKSYLRNIAGFGGKRLYQTDVVVEPDRLLDIYEEENPWSAVTEKTGAEDDGSSIYDWIGRGGAYIIREAGYDWIRLRSIDDAEVWVWVGGSENEPELQEK